MRVFVAGATGAIGRPLVQQLSDRGHEVTGTSRSQERAREVDAAGGRGVVVDALDAAALSEAVVASRAEAVVHQLTAFPREFDPEKIDYEPVNRLRTEGTRNLTAAAQAAGARRIVAQSIAFLYAPEGDRIQDESGRPWTDAPGKFASAVAALVEHERLITEAGGVVLRYGQFYGPGTYFSREGSTGRVVSKRKFPIVGRGDGMTSFIAVDDAAAATVAAIEGGATGVFNVVDDEPAPLREWLPVFAEAIGAPPPRRVPVWIARFLAGRMTLALVTEGRGADNSRAKRELGWQPRRPSWRDGFRELAA